MRCPACSFELPDAARFCGACGVELRVATANALAASTSTSVGSTSLDLLDETGSQSVERTVEAEVEPDFVDDLRLPVVDILSEAIDLLWPNVAPLLLGILVVGVLQSVASAAMVGAVLTGPLSAGVMMLALRIATGRAVAVAHCFDGFKLFLPLLLVGVVKWALTLLGFVCFLVPGLYLLVAFMWAELLVIDRGDDFWPALMTSMRVVNAHFGAHVWLVLSLAALNLLGLCFFVVGLVVTVPLSAVAMAVAYRRIFGDGGGLDRFAA